MAGPRKPRERIVVEVSVKIPPSERLPKPTKGQLTKLARTFKSDVVASLGVRSNDVCSKMIPPPDERPSSRTKR